MIYYKCGKLGHNEGDRHVHDGTQCGGFDMVENPLIDKPNNNERHARPKEVETSGSWMLVKKPLRKKTPRVETGPQPRQQPQDLPKMRPPTNDARVNQALPNN